MSLTIKNCNISTCLGVLIVGAMMPQILGFNGSVFDTLYKVILIMLLVFITNQKEKFFLVSKYFVFYVFMNVVSCGAAIIINDTDIGTEFMDVVTNILLLYLLHEAVMNSYTERSSEIDKFYRIIVYFMLVASVYNIIVNFNSVLNMTSLSVYGENNICSFFDNKNTFGVFLLFGVLAASILKIMTNEIKWTLYACIFLLNEFVAMCRTAIVISLVLIFLSFFLDENQRLKSIFSAICIIGIVIIVLQSNASFNKFIFENLFGDSSSVDIRNSYIENMLPLAKGEHLLFGYGDSNASILAATYTGNQYYHNTYLKELISGGLLGVGIQISGIILSFFYGYRCRVYNKTIGNICIMSTVVYLVYSNFESVLLFDSPVVAMMAVIFIISLPILFYNSMANICSEDRIEH